MARSAGIQTSLAHFCSKPGIFRGNRVTATPLLGAETRQGIWMLAENMLNIVSLRKSLSKKRQTQVSALSADRG